MKDQLGEHNMLDEIKNLIEKHQKLMTQEIPSLDEMELAVNEIRSITQTKEFKQGVQDGSIDFAQAGRIKRLQDSIMEKINEIESSQSGVSPDQTTEKNAFVLHDQQAKSLMNEADDFYWKGKWREAYDAYREVLRIEPSWLRAQDYFQKAKYNYENNVGIPKTAIPDEVKTYYSRAESALSRWELDQARKFLNVAKEGMSKSSLGRWDELEDFSLRLENYLDIHNRFVEAVSFADEQIDTAIDILAMAYEQTRRPLYATKLDELKKRKYQLTFEKALDEFRKGNLELAIEKAESNGSVEEYDYREQLNEWHNLKKEIIEIRATLAMKSIDVAAFCRAKLKLKYYIAKYGENPAFTSVDKLLDVKQSVVEEFSENQITYLIQKAKNSNSIEGAIVNAYEAQTLLKELQDADCLNERLLKFRNEISELIYRLEENDNLLSQVRMSLQNPNKELSDVQRLFERVKTEFPSDPKVLDLSSKFLQKQFEQSFRPAVLAMETAQFEKAIDILQGVKSTFAYQSEDLEILQQIAETSLALQKKYYELMGRGRHFLDVEDFQSALIAFGEADNLVRNSLSIENLSLPEEIK